MSFLNRVHSFLGRLSLTFGLGPAEEGGEVPIPEPAKVYAPFVCADVLSSGEVVARTGRGVICARVLPTHG